MKLQMIRDSAYSGHVADSKTSTGIQIPDDLKKKFPELIGLILQSESMNDEERQYWVNILPVMTPEQIQNLKDILSNEKQQLAAIDRKYAKEIERIGETQLLEQVDEERRRRRTQRSQTEQAAKQEEDEQTQSLLGRIEGKI
ncbi:MAG TPA: hypothetical protein DDX11_05090 [Candidatus Peribacter riflensis]|uniref:Uncharacterized protein n=1 Tax=Candidatus Peribacter riflensis TaxID=1735162 RepID=A0A0S1SUI5_9BACT|nr:MAG: hypothetical protein PeribacterA2_0352 [Candidatus Peribacter riflensis]ALM10845.1 MAG: hypothetical protein PeribacterB2_0352 [Candidatus Peribacter riflensis]ALM11947.1 MAG: hypothetical protein PeribacterC2_0351 [Candidatus Peribacter riflensis]ALM13050.1 MAG: hypothetical protein PeribacterD1_0352 [Candidatus Peribacter riflensis]ALM14150.1 MAG: hypothetical protein PeribacterD2_0351 [Candidatus Peribacter riflensis]